MDQLFTSIALAFSVGIGCGTCCSPFVSAFLSTYVISHTAGAKKSLLAFAGFFGGKLLSVSALCLAASLLGRQFIGADGRIGTFPYWLAVRLLLCAFGVFMVGRWFYEQKKGAGQCGHCGGCENKAKLYPMFIAGVLYGITPCPPLLMMLGYAAALPASTAVVTGASFGLASMVSPVLMLAVILGLLSKRVRAEIPGFLRWFRLASYVLLVILPFTIT